MPIRHLRERERETNRPGKNSQNKINFRKGLAYSYFSWLRGKWKFKNRRNRGTVETLRSVNIAIPPEFRTGIFSLRKSVVMLFEVLTAKISTLWFWAVVHSQITAVLPSGLRLHVDLQVVTVVSDERIVYIFKVEVSAPKMEVVLSSISTILTNVFITTTKTTWRHNPEYRLCFRVR